MPHLHLPTEHTDADLALAGTLAGLLSSEDLYVAWSLEGGRGAPAIPAAIRDPTAPHVPLVRSRRRRSFVGALFDAITARQRPV